ncbi:hypothetical protein Dimus_009677 [Dionaea muscipula]
MGWARGPTIGRGSTATVSLAASDSAGFLAVKSIELPQSHLLQREQKLLSSVSSPHVVSYRGCGISMEHNQLFYNIFMDYVPGGTLADAIRAQAQAGKGKGKGLDEPAIGVYTLHILLGLEYLHSVGIVHCDIKPSNILMGPSGPKIADLGCARRASPVEAMAMAGTPLFMAPEVVRGEEQGFPADIWSLGCTIIEMATGKSPWSAGDFDHTSGDVVPVTLSLVYRIAYCEGSALEYPSWLSEEARDFLSKCLTRDPRERWTAGQLLDHCFIKKFTNLHDHFDHNHNEENYRYGYYNESPTSTLDQGIIWCSSSSSGDHGEAAAEDQIVNQKLQGSEGTSWIRSANHRIRELSETNGFDDWGFGDNWVVIRV